MPGPAIALVLAAAVLHAVWNALAKRAGDPLSFLWLSFALATALLSPVALAALWSAGAQPLAAASPFIVATSAIHTVYFYALGASYRASAFSLVYPVARGLGVALVPVLALLLLGERLSPLGVCGVILVVVGAVALQAGSRPSGPRSANGARGTAWAALTGLSIAGYSLVDKAGVARLSPLAYIALLGLGATVLLGPIMLRAHRRALLRREWAEHRRAILLAATMSLTAYLLVLFAMQRSKTAYVVAAREVSIVLSTIIGSVWLREGPLNRRLAASMLILVGVLCVALAR
jgi:drug/metabolite transporter (DMT)-like permease